MNARDAGVVARFRRIQNPIAHPTIATNIQIHATIDAMTARMYVTLKAVASIFRSTQTVHPSSLRIESPRSVACTESKREDWNDNREQLNHVTTPMVEGSVSQRRDESASGCGKI
jgi:hypothetical protein